MAFKKYLAFICSICPVCIFRRKFPEAKFSKLVEKAEENCPFCRAYIEIHGKH